MVMSIPGRFGDTSGAPFVEGRLHIPRLGIETNVSFLVDTGADQTVLMPEDGIRSGVDYSMLTGGEDVVGVGGTVSFFVEPAYALFLDLDSGSLHRYDCDLLIAPPAPDMARVHSLLGRNIINRWRMSYDPEAPRLSFEVISSDLSYPISGTS